jgi:hypothetical protein
MALLQCVDRLAGTYGKVFKAKDVEDADEGACLTEGALDAVVDLLHEPVEQAAVEHLGQRVPRADGLYIGTHHGTIR